MRIDADPGLKPKRLSATLSFRRRIYRSKDSKPLMQAPPITALLPSPGACFGALIFSILGLGIVHKVDTGLRLGVPITIYKNTITLDDGTCLSLLGLAPEWAVNRRSRTNLIQVDHASGENGRLGFSIGTYISPQARYDYANNIIGFRALPAYNVQGLKAWAADDGVIVFADGPAHRSSIVVECMGDVPRIHIAATCLASDYKYRGPGQLTVQFPPTAIENAVPLIERADHLAEAMSVPCGVRRRLPSSSPK